MKYIGRSSVWIMFGERKRRPTGMGSGTLMRAASGAPMVLTARHVVESLGHLSLLVVGDKVPDDFWAPEFELRLHPDPDVDVALVVLPGADELSPFCVGADALSDEGTLTEDKEGYVVAGWPDQFSLERMTTDGKKRDLLRASIIYGTTLLGRDRRRLSLNFRRAETANIPRVQDWDIPAEGPLELKRPGTISGGSVWRQRPPSGLIWTPESAARIVGVAVEFTEKRSELAEPIERWGDWVRSELAMQ